MRIRSLRDLALSVALAMPTVLFAQSAPPSGTSTASSQSASQAVQAPKSPQEREALKLKLEAKTKEVDTLKDKAIDTTKKMAELASSGKIPTSQEGVQAMKEMVQQLEEIQKALQTIKEEIEAIKGWIEGQNEALPIMTNDINDLKRNRWGNYIQTQYRDTDQVGGATDGFSIRRMRLGLTQTIDPRTVLRASFDLATSTTNNVAQLRDAFIRWDLEPSLEKVGTELTFGQFPLALGYELERSSGEREFPERTLYNRTMFAGERSRGIMIKHGLSAKSHMHIGGYNALTFDDPEQRSVAPAPGNKLAMSGGVRVYDSNYDLGLSYFRGERNAVTTTRTANNVTTTYVHPDVMREYFFIDGTYVGLIDPNLFLRFEYMKGKDRVPVAPGANNSVSSVRGRVNMEGHQVHLGYNLNKRNQLNVRWEEFDADTAVTGNSVTTYATAYSYFINPNARITLSREWVEDPSRVTLNDVKYQITTLRVIFRF